MRRSVSSLGMALSLLAMMASPLVARAQQPSATRATEETSLESKRVTLDVENGFLSGAIKVLMANIQASYTLDNTLRDATVTAHLTNVPFPVALDTLMKASSLPATYAIEEGIYRFIPRVAPPTLSEPPIAQPPVAQPTSHVAAIRLNFVDASVVARFLGGTVFSVLGQNYGWVDNSVLTGRWGEAPAIGSAPTAGSGVPNGLFGGNGLLLGNAGSGFRGYGSTGGSRP